VQTLEKSHHRILGSHGSERDKRPRRSQQHREVNAALLKFLIHYEYRNTSTRSARSFGICACIVVAGESAMHAARTLQARGDASCAKNRDTSFSFHITKVTRAPDHLHGF
jgi:hypothetical protein